MNWSFLTTTVLFVCFAAAAAAAIDLINIFEVFLPQLLLYPNPSDPLNGEAAALLLRDPERYKSIVKGKPEKKKKKQPHALCFPLPTMPLVAQTEYVKKYATEEALDAKSESDMSEDLSSYSDISDGENGDDVFPASSSS